MQEIACPKCKIIFILPDKVDNRFKQSGEEFYCPNGHGMSYEDSLAAKLEAVERRAALYHGYFEEERTKKSRLLRSNAALRAVITRMKSKAAGQFLLPISELEKRAVDAVLTQCGGNRENAAKRLQIGVRSVYRKIKKHGLTNKRYRRCQQSRIK